MEYTTYERKGTAACRHSVRKLACPCLCFLEGEMKHQHARSRRSFLARALGSSWVAGGFLEQAWLRVAEARATAQVSLAPSQPHSVHLQFRG